MYNENRENVYLHQNFRLHTKPFDGAFEFSLVVASLAVACQELFWFALFVSFVCFSYLIVSLPYASFGLKLVKQETLLDYIDFDRGDHLSHVLP